MSFLIPSPTPRPNPASTPIVANASTDANLGRAGAAPSLANTASSAGLARKAPTAKTQLVGG